MSEKDRQWDCDDCIQIYFRLDTDNLPTAWGRINMVCHIWTGSISPSIIFDKLVACINLGHRTMSKEGILLRSLNHTVRERFWEKALHFLTSFGMLNSIIKTVLFSDFERLHCSWFYRRDSEYGCVLWDDGVSWNWRFIMILSEV